MSEFVSMWAIINTALLALTVPADTYAPRFRLECTRAQVDDRDRLFLISAYSMIAGLLTALVPLALVAVGALGLDVRASLAIALFSLASALFASRRAFLTSNGEFATYLRQTAVLSGVGVVGLFVVLATDTDHQAPLYLALALGNLVAAVAVSPRGSLSMRQSVGRVQSHIPFLRSINAVPTLSRLVVVTLVAALLSNGALMVANFVGAAPSKVVAFAAAVNLVLIPYMLINSFTGPIHNRFVRSILRGEYAVVRRDYFRTSGYYLAAVLGLSVSSFVALGFAVKLYVGAEYDLARTAYFGIAMGEGLATVTALPRALLVALGLSRIVTPIWLGGLATFVAILALPLDPIHRMVLAPILSSAGILLVATLRIDSHLRSRLRQLPVNGSDR